MIRICLQLTILCLKQNQTQLQNEQQDSIDEKIDAEIKGLLPTENLNAETEEAKVLNWGEQNKVPIYSRFARKYLSAPSSSVYSKNYILEPVTYTKKIVIDCFQRTVKNFYFSTTS